MAHVEATIDSIRVAAASPERMLILKEKGEDNYLSIWVSPSHAEILAAQLHRRPDKKKDLALFLTTISAADADDIKCTTIYLEDTTFYGKVLLSRHGRSYGVRCPIGVALALAVRTNAPILVDEALFDKAGVRLS